MIEQNKPPDLLKRASEILPYLLLVILAYIVMVQISPHHEWVPRVDSRVYLYIGDRILKGAVPYRDVWDNKGPLIYYINALGLALSGGSVWGVWCLEFIAVIAAAMIGFNLFKRVFGIWPALFASALLVLELRLVLDKGNMTEEYALPFQFLLLWMIWRATKIKQHPAIYFSIGVVAALCFLLRPNIIGIPLAFGLILFWQAAITMSKETWGNILAMAVGGLWIVGLAALYFLLHGALAALWDGMFAFNFVYNGWAEEGKTMAVITGFNKMPIAMAFGVTGWGLAIWSLRSKEALSPRRILALVVALGLPLELLLTGLSGFYFTHYYMSWLPLLALSTAFGLQLISSTLDQRGTGWPEPGRLAKAMALMLMLIFVLLPTLELLPDAQATLTQTWEDQALPEHDPSDRAWWPVVAYAKENLKPDQSLLVWGHEVGINRLAQRDPPIRYVYQTPLLVEGYMSAELADQLIQEMEANPPTIIDTGPPGGFMPSLNTPLDELPQDLRTIYKYFQENYEFAGTFKDIGWDLYLYHGEGETLKN